DRARVPLAEARSDDERAAGFLLPEVRGLPLELLLERLAAPEGLTGILPDTVRGVEVEEIDAGAVEIRLEGRLGALDPADQLELGLSQERQLGHVVVQLAGPAPVLVVLVRAAIRVVQAGIGVLGARSEDGLRRDRDRSATRNLDFLSGDDSGLAGDE